MCLLPSKYYAAHLQKCCVSGIPFRTVRKSIRAGEGQRAVSLNQRKACVAGNHERKIVVALLEDEAGYSHIV